VPETPSVAEVLQRLALHDDGFLTDGEFASQKEAFLSASKLRDLTTADTAAALQEIGELETLAGLVRSNVLTRAEFDDQKQAYLTNSEATPSGSDDPLTGNRAVAVDDRGSPKTRKVSTGWKVLLVPVGIFLIWFVREAVRSEPASKVTGTVYSVVPLDGDTVRVFMSWKDSGKTAASASCVLDTEVFNRFGDNVNVEANSTGTNGQIKPGQSQRIYQDIGVNSGDAPYITRKDVSITDC